jgi:hypothetical protein
VDRRAVGVRGKSGRGRGRGRGWDRVASGEPAGVEVFVTAAGSNDALRRCGLERGSLTRTRQAARARGPGSVFVGKRACGEGELDSN